jgi:hypothetical protein
VKALADLGVIGNPGELPANSGIACALDCLFQGQAQVDREGALDEIAIVMLIYYRAGCARDKWGWARKYLLEACRLMHVKFFYWQFAKFLS